MRMQRIVLTSLAALMMTVATTGATLTNASAAIPSAGKVCPAFTKSGKTFRWNTVGTGFTCTSAKPWVEKLSGEHVRKATAEVPLSGGPKRYHCFATIEETNGRAIAGLCYLGTLAFPKSGFSWFAA